MSNLIRQPFHLVEESPWPLVRIIGAFFLTTGLVKWFRENTATLLLLGLIIILITITQWWTDISYEGTNQGLHSGVVELGLRYGMVLFIVSEVIFFRSFFWAFFHRRLRPNIEIGVVWPSPGLLTFDPLDVPLLNTIILLSSGLTATWAHHAVIVGNHSSANQGLSLTICLGVYFTALQALEYYEASFRIADRVYGSSFFTATGFHGLHVIIGSVFLLVCNLRLKAGQLALSHHFGFEAAIWYWHFVDVVWLFLYVTIYWWRGASFCSIIIIFQLQWKDLQL